MNTLRVSVNSNAKELMRKYNRRCEKLLVLSVAKPRGYAIALSEIRKKNIENMIYQRTPYVSERASKKPTFRLLEGERVSGSMVFNDAEYASQRANMTGNYAISPGQSREANWPEESVKEFLPAMRLQQIAMNSNILKG